VLHLVKADRALGAKLLVHLGEVDERGLYREHGYSSMIEYCLTALRMSEAESYLRIHAARLGRRFPLILELLAEGALNLSAIKLLAQHLTQDNHVVVLDRARGKGKREVELLVAELSPKPDVPASVRKLPAAPSLFAAAPTAAPRACSANATTDACASVPASALEPSATFALQPPRARASSTPLSPGRFKLVLTLDQAAHDNLEQLQELLRHQNPSGDLATIIERALRVLLEREKKQRFGQTSARKQQVARKRAQAKVETGGLPAKANTDEVNVTGKVSESKSQASEAKSRYIPRKIRHEVFARDGGQCTFVSADGRRCQARGFLELHHHEVTFARGGDATAENLRLTCRAHNSLWAERDYGRGFVQSKLREAAVQRSQARSFRSGA
jgi:5-methylcytosine-specific restriction endonuclease McrA